MAVSWWYVFSSVFGGSAYGAVVVGSDYNDSVPHVFNNFTRKGVITGSDSQSTPAQVFTSTAHSAE